MKPLVCVMNARRIPECIESLERLDCDVAWMSGYTDAQLGPVHQKLVEDTEYDAYIVVSDDCVVTQDAVDAVVALLEEGRPAATGWCKLHRGSPLANLSSAPLIGNMPRLDAYRFYRASVVRGYESEVVPTHFMGFSLTGMPKEMWQRFPYTAYTLGGVRRGYSSDFNLCARLRDAEIPMVAARDGYVEHVKVSNRRDRPRSHRVLIGRMQKQVRLKVAV